MMSCLKNAINNVLCNKII
jgi:hypothetical protein